MSPGASRPGIGWGGIVGRLAIVALVAGVCWAIGLSLPNALSLGLFGVALYSLRRLTAGEVETWLPEPESTHNTGTRREIARLSWGLQGQDARVDRWSANRLHALAARRLAARDLDLDLAEDEAACRRVLGGSTYDALSLDPNHLPRYTSFVAALGVVERLSLEETDR